MGKHEAKASEPKAEETGEVEGAWGAQESGHRAESACALLSGTEEGQEGQGQGHPSSSQSGGLSGSFQPPGLTAFCPRAPQARGSNLPAPLVTSVVSRVVSAPETPKPRSGGEGHLEESGCRARGPGATEEGDSSSLLKI